MNQPAAHNRAWETAETVFGIPLLISFILDYFFPLPFPAWIPRWVTTLIGIGLIAGGLWMIAAIRRQFRQTGQPTDPGLPTTQIITTGPFSWSRNPLYLAGAIFYAGLGVLSNSLWVLASLILAVAAVQIVLIAPEERYLDAKFGEAYRQYRSSVRRWVGRRK